MAFIITCAGAKRIPRQEYGSGPEELSYSKELSDARKHIQEATGIELDWSRTLPAWMLYSGPGSEIYQEVSERNWLKPCAEVKILSALFGIIRHTDRIPWYDLRITEKCRDDRAVWEHWRSLNVLGSCVDENDVDALSAEYRMAFNGTGEPVTGLKFVDFRENGAEVGRWLNTQLDGLKC